MIHEHADDVASSHGQASAAGCSSCPHVGDWFETEDVGTPYLVRLCLRTSLTLPEGGRRQRPGWCPLANQKAGHDLP